MFNYHFKTYGETTERDVYVMEKDYLRAVDKLIEDYGSKFYTYQFLGVED